MGHGQLTPDSRAKNDENHKAAVSIRPNLMAVHDGNGRAVGVLLVFDEGSVELSDACKQRLKGLLPEYRGKPHKIEIRGHAIQNSSSAEPSSADAWERSYARCRATMRFLVAQGIEPERIRLSQGGPYEPYSISSDPADRLPNSRVEIYLLSELAQDLIGTPEERAKRFKDPGKLLGRRGEPVGEEVLFHPSFLLASPPVALSFSPGTHTLILSGVRIVWAKPLSTMRRR